MLYMDECQIFEVFWCGDKEGINIVWVKIGFGCVFEYVYGILVIFISDKDGNVGCCVCIFVVCSVNSYFIVILVGWVII